MCHRALVSLQTPGTPSRGRESGVGSCHGDLLPKWGLCHQWNHAYEVSLVREASRECPENGSVNSGVPAKARASRFLNSGEPGQAGNGAAKSRSRLKWTDCTPEASVPVRGASKSGNLFGSEQGGTWVLPEPTSHVEHPGWFRQGSTRCSHTFSAFWLRSSVVSVLTRGDSPGNSLISVMCSMSTTLIKRIFKPSPASLACKMLGRGAPIAVLGVAAGGSQ